MAERYLARSLGSLLVGTFVGLIAGCSGASASITDTIEHDGGDSTTADQDASLANGGNGSPASGDDDASSAAAGSDGGSTGGDAPDAAIVIPTDLVVNGHTLNAGESKWMVHVSQVVVPRMPGDRTTRIKQASEAGWWSLKEGDFDVSDPPAYSNCSESSGDTLIGPLDICSSTAAWQVGLAGVQVTGHTVSEMEMRAATLVPSETSDQLVADAAGEAGFAVGSSTYNAIVASTGQLRVSWLLRNSLIGFAVVSVDEVEPECITGTKSWCFGSGWDETKLFAPTKTAAMQSVSDIEGILDRLSPP